MTATRRGRPPGPAKAAVTIRLTAEARAVLDSLPGGPSAAVERLLLACQAIRRMAVDAAADEPQWHEMNAYKGASADAAAVLRAINPARYSVPPDAVRALAQCEHEHMFGEP